MEPRSGLIIIALVTTTVVMFAIFAGCNAVHPEFDFNGNGADSIEKKCAEFPNTAAPGSFVTKYKKCINKNMDREFACANWFWWLRY